MALRPLPMRTFDLADTAATERLGATLAAVLARPCCVWLEGDLGAGKTTLVRALLRTLGHAGSVKSPTYTLIEPYELAAGPVYHLDLYRLADPEELEFLGVRELAGATSVVLVEWPARGAGFLPAADLVVALALHGDGRHARIEARTPCGAAMLQALPDKLEPAA